MGAGRVGFRGKVGRRRYINRASSDRHRQDSWVQLAFPGKCASKGITYLLHQGGRGLRLDLSNVFEWDGHCRKGSFRVTKSAGCPRLALRSRLDLERAVFRERQTRAESQPIRMGEGRDEAGVDG